MNSILHPEIMRGIKHDLDYEGWSSQAHRGFPGRFDSSNVSRRNVSRRIGVRPEDK